MAYLRGRYYVWGDCESTHFWVAGKDGEHWDREHGGPSGDRVAIPDAIFDALALMRVAEIIGEGRLPQAIDAALRKHGGNFGSAELYIYGEALKAACVGLTGDEGRWRRRLAAGKRRAKEMLAAEEPPAG